MAGHVPRPFRSFRELGNGRKRCFRIKELLNSWSPKRLSLLENCIWWRHIKRGLRRRVSGFTLKSCGHFVGKKVSGGCYPAWYPIFSTHGVKILVYSKNAKSSDDSVKPWYRPNVSLSKLDSHL